MKCRSIDAQAENIGGAGFCPNSAAAAVLLFMLLKYTAAFSTTTPLMYYISMHPMFGMQIENCGGLKLQINQSK